MRLLTQHLSNSWPATWGPNKQRGVLPDRNWLVCWGSLTAKLSTFSDKHGDYDPRGSWTSHSNGLTWIGCCAIERGLKHAVLRQCCNPGDMGMTTADQVTAPWHRPRGKPLLRPPNSQSSFVAPHLSLPSPLHQRVWCVFCPGARILGWAKHGLQTNHSDDMRW